MRGVSTRAIVLVLPVLIGLSAAATPVAAQAIISNGTVQLGVNRDGSLNTPGPRSAAGTHLVGLRFVPTNNEATAAGCPCEGWGAANMNSGVWGGANQAFHGATGVNLVLESFAATGTEATSIVRIGGTYRVAHRYKPSSTPNLYQVDVSVENISAATARLRYRRAMDWDIEPTPFNEFSTIVRGTATNIVFSSTNGFANSNPFTNPGGGFQNVSVNDAGPTDHGAVFDFDFGNVLAGEVKTFRIFYGAAGNETDALNAIAVAGAQAYSFGQPNVSGGPTLGIPNTFIFAFTGVGGDPVIRRDSDVRIAKAASPVNVPNDANTAFSITVTNDGPGAATNVVVADTLPAGLTFVSCAASSGGVCAASGAIRTITFETLTVGETATITLVARMDSDVAHNTVLTNTASVTTRSTDPNLANNSASAAVTAIDAIKPVSTAMVTPAPNAAGWHRADVTVSLSATDNAGGSGVQQITYWTTGAQASLATAVAGASYDVAVVAEGSTVVHFFATDRAGNAEAWGEVTVRIDKTAPTVEVSRAPLANVHGWNNGEVTATWVATDSLSGVDGASADSEAFLSEGAGQGGTRTFRDLAGNEASAAIADINIDRTAPDVSVTRAPLANANGWNNTAVTADWTASDLLSGMDGDATATAAFSAEGTGLNANRTFRDRAGNETSSAVAGINIDLSAPTLSATRAPLANSAGWNNTNVTAVWTADDSLSGIDGPDTLEHLFTAEGAGQSASRSVVDRAGNQTTLSLSGVSIDKTAPVVSVVRTPSANGSGWNNTDVTATWTAVDPLSGVAGAATAVVVFSAEAANQGDLRSFGDLAGNTGSAAITGINIDKTAPTITCGTGEPVLWPPNHKLVPVSFRVTVDDSFGGAAGFTLVSLTSNEPDNGQGDGDTAGDIQGFTLGTPDTDGLLRAERRGQGAGRIYTATYRGVDIAGNEAICTPTIGVPHDQRK